MTLEDYTVFSCTQGFGSYGEPHWRIARRADLPMTLVKVILEKVLLVLGYVQVRYIDRGYRWSRTALGDQIAEGRHGR
ncbi:hypothetical protein [Azospirillum sp.]|uniref:hypothetical protein n=1 Tax=Azospirillum sp. TaxID=34012 RepID=UPI003D737995